MVNHNPGLLLRPRCCGCCWLQLLLRVMLLQLRLLAVRPTVFAARPAALQTANALDGVTGRSADR